MAEFIKVQKDGETIEISPLTLEEHLKLGWKIVEPEHEKQPGKQQPAEKKEEAETPAEHKSRGK